MVALVIFVLVQHGFLSPQHLTPIVVISDLENLRSIGNYWFEFPKGNWKIQLEVNSNTGLRRFSGSSPSDSVRFKVEEIRPPEGFDYSLEGHKKRPDAFIASSVEFTNTITALIAFNDARFTVLYFSKDTTGMVEIILESNDWAAVDSYRDQLWQMIASVSLDLSGTNLVNPRCLDLYTKYIDQVYRKSFEDGRTG